MMTKKIVKYDNVNHTDAINCIIDNSLKTSIDIRCAETGEIIFKNLKNKVIISGSGLIARKLFDIPNPNNSKDPEITPTYNTRLNILTPTGAQTHTLDWKTNATISDPKVLLFCVGRDGCGTENSQVFPVSYTKWIGVDSIIPFRYPLLTNDLNSDLRQKYFGRVISGNHVAYYFKRFSEEPRLVQRYIDGTAIDSSVYESDKTDSAETYVEMILKITKEDLRDYFKATTGIDTALINTVSLCYAWPIEINGELYFNDIRPITKLNFPNEPMIDLAKGIDIIYHVYM